MSPNPGNPRLKIQILDDRYRGEWGMPVRAHPGDAGIDLRACTSAAIYIAPGTEEKVRLGVAVEIPPDFAGLLMPRSGRLEMTGGDKTRIRLANAIGLIDPTYRGEVCAIVHNAGGIMWINPGDKIAQLVVVYAPALSLHFVDELSSSDRGADGFGSSGSR